MADFPRSYKDPLYASLDAKNEQDLGLPSGLLSSIRTNGERSNADQVSSAGAKTPYQIIGATRDAAIKKYGIDPQLSPQNASKVAGLLLKDSLDRNNGDMSAAVAEYHGGTNRKNWGPITQSYVKRVVTPLQGQTQAARSSQDQSNSANLSEISRGFGDFLKANPAIPEKTTETAQQQTQQAGANQSQPESSDQSQISSGFGQWLQSNPAQPEAQPDNRGIVQRFADTLTGNDRKTQTSESLPDWAGMPELNQFSMDSFKTGLGTMATGPDETVKVIKSNFPNVGVRQDEKGNYILKSSVDGQEYALKPGFRLSDIPRALGQVAAFTPAGRAESLLGLGAGAAATQAGIEATQAATGGDFNAGDVATTGIIGAAAPAIMSGARGLVGGASDAIGQGINKLTGTEFFQNAKAAAQQSAKPAQAATQQATQQAAAPVSQMGGEELAQTARKAAEGGFGSDSAKKVLAEQASPNQETIDAAKRLGIDEYLQPDHVTTSQAYREVSQAIKSVPGSEARAAEKEGLEKVAERADKIITQLGGSEDLSTVSSSVKAQMSATTKQLEDKADTLYSDLRKAIPAQTEVPATNTLSFLERRSSDMGGSENLTAVERKLAARLKPKTTTTEAQPGSQIVDESGRPLNPALQPQKVVSQPSYALIDDLRKQVGQAIRNNSGPFKDGETGLLKHVYGLLESDITPVVEQQGAGDLLKAAKSAVQMRKAIEDDMVGIFGKNLDGTMVGDLNRSVGVLAKGDAAQLTKLVGLIKSIPEEMRQQVVASGLSSAFGKTARNGNINFGSYSRWYENMMKNKQAASILFNNLPKEARSYLADLYKVSKGISDATRERITTGRITAVTKEFNGAENLLGKIYEVARKSAGGLAAEVGTSAIGAHGVGLAAGLASALSGAKTEAIKAADKLIASPEFIQAAKQAGTGQTKKASLTLVSSKPFKDFVRAAKNPSEMSDRQRWVLQAIESQSANNRRSNER